MRLLTITALATFASCGGPSGPHTVAYVSLDEIFSREILLAFTKQTGIEVVPRFDAEFEKTTGLMNRILQLKRRPEADVFWNNEIMNSIRLKREGVLEKYVPPTAADIPDEFKDADGTWVGFAARARVILYNTDLVKESEAPRSVYDFLKPGWRGRFAIARPLSGTTYTHAVALFAHLGADRANALLKGWVDNEAMIVMGNAVARNRVMDGHVAACLTDTDDANGALLQGKPVRMVFPDQGEGEMGTLVIPNTVVLIKGGPNPENGKKLVDFIASREVEAQLAKIKGAQMPLRGGIPPYSPDFDFTKIKAMKVDWNLVADQIPAAGPILEEVFK
ncbi:MAG TPA: extracellular solute-binding protein [Planctomycetota bacterium]|nr:extracellular solute-binding protein [Planctomycetota bacterium]